MPIDKERCRQIIVETLRSVDSDAGLALRVDELDFADLSVASPEYFPIDELAEFVESWLGSLEPDGGPFSTEWVGGGVRIVISAGSLPGQ